MSRRTMGVLHGVLGLAAALAVAAPARGQVIPNLPAGSTIMMIDSPPGSNPEPTGSGRIRGRVVDADSGTPLADTLITITGGPLRTSRRVGTDDEGRFELGDLPTGRFTLIAIKPGYVMLEYGQRRPFESGKPVDLADKQVLEELQFALPRGGVIVARVTDESGEPISNIRVQAQRFRSFNGDRRLTNVSQTSQVTDDRGEIRLFGLPPGEYYVSAIAPTNGPPTPTGPQPTLAANAGRSYLPTYFPGTPMLDAAERVSVQIGKEVNVAFTLVAARPVRVSGTVRRADGSPAPRSSVILNSRVSPVFLNSVQTQADGTFVLPSVPPGDYTLQVMYSTSPTERESARMPITIASADVTGVTVGLIKTGVIRGRIAFDTAPPANVRLAGLQIVLYNSGSTLSGASAQNDGTFALNAVFEPGVLRVQSLPEGWYLKSVTVGGRDLTDTVIGAGDNGDPTSVEVMLTQTRATLAGSVADDKGAAVADYTVVLFPEDRALWTPMSRFVASARPDQQGLFKITGLPPGPYLAAAVDYIETGTERDAEVLDRLRARATSIVLGDGEAKTVALTLVVQ